MNFFKVEQQNRAFITSADDYFRETIYKQVTYKFIKYYRERYTQGYYDQEWENTIESDPENVYAIICHTITCDRPCLITRFGSNELEAAINYKRGHPFGFLRTVYPFWVSKTTKERMITNAGFFPKNNKSFSGFADLILEVSRDIDIFGTWIGKENNIPLKENCKKVKLRYLEPF